MMRTFKPPLILIHTIVFRYISWQIAKATLAVTLLLSGVYIFITFLSQMYYIGRGHYDLYSILEYSLFTLPQNIYYLFPTINLLGVLLGLSIPTAHNEIIIMRASGLSPTRITFITLQTTIIILVIAVAMGEGIAPNWSLKAEQQRALAENNNLAIRKQSLWLRQGLDFIHIGNIVNSKNLINISDYHNNGQQQLSYAIQAGQAIFRKNHWSLIDSHTTFFKKNQVTSTQLQQQPWPVNIDYHIFNLLTIPPQNMSLIDLYHYINYQKKNKLNMAKYNLIFWQRVLEPLVSLAMILVAIPSIFGSLREITIGVRLVAGVITGCLFYLINYFLAPISLKYQFPPFFAAISPLVIFSLFGLWLVNKVK